MMECERATGGKRASGGAEGDSRAGAKSNSDEEKFSCPGSGALWRGLASTQCCGGFTWVIHPGQDFRSALSI